MLQAANVFADVRPELYALLNMAGVLAAVAATGVARLLVHDSIYSRALHERGACPSAATPTCCYCDA